MDNLSTRIRVLKAIGFAYRDARPPLLPEVTA
jgi:hypothetical protein